MKALVTEDTKVLIPNAEHKNFTAGSEIIEAETIIEGQPRNILGLRKGEPFTYRLFYTNDNKIIYIKKIKPMEKTEVVLGADATQTATVVSLPNQSNLGKRPIIGAAVGAVAAFAWAKYKKHDHKKAALYAVVGAVVGFVAGKYLQSHNPITAKASK